ncbi:hypothetical protein TSUD_387410 [Trifolium subterraneum]|uniref:Protein kinase domain-containing protein n=1 Tax=Trifolium subterraneum TaxID=3900 RepID=A0A2Z6NDT5_TRISU|nr:hypothetical protein TSUD_387410 [Trifolium subterraneum]
MMEENTTSSWLRRAKYSQTVCHRLDTNSLNANSIRVQLDEISKPSSNVKENLLTNKQRSLSPLPRTFVNDVFREARHEAKRFSTPGRRRDNKRIMGKVSNKDTREASPKLSSSKSVLNSQNQQREVSKNMSKDGSWSKYLENGSGGGGGKVTALETAEEWTIDMSKLFLGHKFAHGAHSRLYHGVYKDESVAVKIIRAPDDDENGDLTAKLENQFIREVTLLSRLHHRNVIKLVIAALRRGRCLLSQVFSRPVIRGVRDIGKNMFSYF